MVFIFYFKIEMTTLCYYWRQKLEVRFMKQMNGYIVEICQNNITNQRTFKDMNSAVSFYGNIINKISEVGVGVST
jgi:hypothetical protein